MKKLLLVLITLSLANPAQARMVEGADRARPSKVSDLDTASGGSVFSKWRSRAEKEAKSLWTTVQKQINERVKTGPSDKSTERQPTSVAETSAPIVPVVVKTDEQKEHLAIIQETQKEIEAKPAVQVSIPGRAGDLTLPKTKAGVAAIPLFTTKKRTNKQGKTREIKIKVDKLPLLDIGTEKTISASDFIGTERSVGFQPKTVVEEKSSPQLYTQQTFKKKVALPVAKVEKAKAPQSQGYKLGDLVSQKKIQDIPLVMAETKPLDALKPFRPYSDNELKMLSAVLTYEKKNKCHIAIGMFHDLARKKEFSEEANFYLGVCAHQVGFHTEAVTRLVDVIKSENPHFTAEAIKNVVEDLPVEYDQTVARAILNVKNKKLVPDDANNAVQYVLARAAYAAKNYTSTIQNAQQVKEKSKHYTQAQYLLGVAQYASKNAKSAEKTLTDLRSWMEKNNKVDKNLMALVAVNLGRIRFNQGRYHASHQEYMKVPKDHPVWVDALIEQGWAQLHVDDAAGAIGNMYSLHSPYFKSVFKPESWVVRTLGYIDICQYGDAYRSLSKLEHMSKSHLDQIKKYRTENKGPDAYYQTVRTYIQGRSDGDVNGLPAQVIREIARQRGFLNAQNTLNKLEDETTQYNFIYGLIKKDQASVKWNSDKSKERLAKVRADLVLAKTDNSLAKHINEWRATERNELALISAYAYQSKLYEEARRDYVKMRTTAIARIDRLKGNQRSTAARELMAHLSDIQSRIEQMIEGNEFLRYEIYSGSGENIRYQVAGGTTAETLRIPAHIKPQKILNWQFDGEYWEDEIGSYRSTLKNNCPNNRRSVSSTPAEKSRTAAINY